MEEPANKATSVQYRLSATLLTGKRKPRWRRCPSSGSNRVADAKGKIRLRLWPEEVPLLLARGFELHVHRAIPTWSAAEVRIILNALDIWLVPCTNPDGRQYVLTTEVREAFSALLRVAPVGSARAARAKSSTKAKRRKAHVTR